MKRKKTEKQKPQFIRKKIEIAELYPHLIIILIHNINKHTRTIRSKMCSVPVNSLTI